MTNCPSERRWFGNNDAGNDGVSIGPCGGGAARFLDASQECAWFGISCGPGPSSPGVSGADAYHLVQDPPAIEQPARRSNEFYRAFGGLWRWDMAGNRLGKTLSKDVGRLTELEGLEL